MNLITLLVAFALQTIPPIETVAPVKPEPFT